MKIGIVSDTHCKQLPQKMLNDFKEVDLIVHAGDFCCLDELHILSKIKELKAVYGNMDEEGIRKLLPETQIFKVESTAIGLYHGEGSAKGLLSRVKEKFKNDKLDIVIFGHSHHPCNERIGDTLYFNPGSPNDEVIAPYCSYGILEIHGKQITGKIVKIK